MQDSQYFTDLGHANDMTCTTIDSKTNLYVVTMNANSNGLVKLSVSGSKIKKEGNFTLRYNGKVTSMSGVNVYKKTSSIIPDFPSQ